MKIVVICGHPCSGFQLAYETLTEAGLGCPQPSQRESLSPTELHEKIFKAQDLDPTGLNVHKPISLGKIWQDLAVDLFVGNMEQKHWGWEDARSVWLLDFWKELDPQVHFVLVYSAPEFALGKALSDSHATPGEIESVLASWIAYQSEILRFYNRNPDRSLLVNAEIIIHDPKLFIEKTINTFGMDLTLPPSEHPVSIDSVSAIATTLAKALIEDDDEAYALYRELESAADIAGPNALASNAEKRQALEEFTALLARLDKTKVEISENAEYVNKLHDEQTEFSAALQFKILQLTGEGEEQTKAAAEWQTQIQQLTQAQNEYENLKEEHARLTHQFNDLQAKLNGEQTIALSKQAELTQENELQLLQLHQVQEELESYFLQVQELTQARDEQTKAAAEWLAQVQQLTQTQNKYENLNEEHARLTHQFNDLQAKLQGEQTIALSQQAELTQENELLLLQLHQIQEELESYFLQVQELTQARDEQTKAAAEWQTQIQQLTQQARDEQAKQAMEWQAQVQQLTQARDEQTRLAAELQVQTIPSSKQAELAQENELLLLQLYQVQEELEHYFLQWQELSAKGGASAEEATTFINRFWSKHQPSEVVIDFRDEIEGDNWYYAEADGRWAGPGNVSTVKLPSLRKGRYEFYLDVVDAVMPEVISGMEVSLNGTVLQTTFDGAGYPAVVYSEFTVKNVDQNPVWEFQFKFPKMIIPGQHGSDDNRNLAIRVRSLKLRVSA